MNYIWISSSSPHTDLLVRSRTDFQQISSQSYFTLKIQIYQREVQKLQFWPTLSSSGSYYMSFMGHPLLSQFSLWPWLLAQWEQAPQTSFFSELTIFKNANLHIFGLVIAVFAYFKPLGQLIEAPHGTSTTFSVLSMTSTVGLIGTSPQKKYFVGANYLEKC